MMKANMQINTTLGLSFDVLIFIMMFLKVKELYSIKILLKI